MVMYYYKLLLIMSEALVHIASTRLAGYIKLQMVKHLTSSWKLPPKVKIYRSQTESTLLRIVSILPAGVAVVTGAASWAVRSFGIG